MNRTKLKNYAPQARRDFINAITNRAAYYGLTENQIEPITEQGDVAIIGGRAFPRTVAPKRKRLEERIARHGFTQVMEAMAYTWFNRLVAIRFMELHGYLDHGYRVLSHPEDKDVPEIVEHAEHVELPGLNTDTIIDLKLDGTKEAELYRLLLIAQCNALHDALPFLFERIDDETELLLPDNLLHSNSLIRNLVNEIDSEDWQEVEIIGWLYQFYISEKKDQVIGKVVKSEDIPAATQLFTPNWIVKYMVQNSLGAQWLATYPDAPLREKMEYYIEPAEQTPEVQAQLKAITPDSLNPEELTLLDPACGSGHILVEAYELLKEIYLERGYRIQDIPTLILQKNLFGLEIDDRAAQLAAFALMMKARADDRRIFGREVQPQVLSFQESKGLNAKQLADAINAPVVLSKRPDSDEFEFMEDVNTPLFSKKNLAVKGEIEEGDVATLVALFEEAKTFGSLITVPEELAEKLPVIAQRVEDVLAYGDLEGQAAARRLEPLVAQVSLLARKYDAVVTNPPYMGSKYYSNSLKHFVNIKYKTAKGDLYACFVLRSLEFSCSNGFAALITIPTWMFISTFESLRHSILNKYSIDTFVDNGRGVFGSDFGTSSFVLRNLALPQYRAVYRRLIGRRGGVSSNEELQGKFFDSNDSQVSCDDLKVIPGNPIAYLVSSKVRQIFRSHARLDSIADFAVGLFTCSNDRFLRFWHEVDIGKVGFNCRDRTHASQSGKKWFSHHKGGPFKKWYGNRDYVVFFPEDGREISEFRREVGQSYSLPGHRYYFREGITWSHTTASHFSARFSDTGSISNVEGPTLFTKFPEVILAFLCSNIGQYFMRLVNPTFHYRTGNVASLPFDQNILEQVASQILDLSHRCVEIARKDWESFEESWTFSGCPLLGKDARSGILADSYMAFSACFEVEFQQMKQTGEEINEILLSAYGLENEVPSKVEDDQITLTRPDREEDIKRLLSYALGCMMGRYSLDKPGLIYAHGENNGFDPSRYTTFPADQDGIVPLMETEWFPDDATNRFVEFISIAWPKDHLEENLTFVSDSLSPNRNEQPLDTIRRYFATGFFKDHLKTYKRRPIYWLFSSGKQRAFQCLVYLHRYNDGTLSRMRTEYVIPLQGKIAARIDQLKDDAEKATSTSHRRKLEKERDTFLKQQTELHAFDEKLRHYADQRISLDLDDGVKVNYGKFGDLLAEVKVVCGKA